MKKVILEYPESSGIKIYTRPNGSFVVRIPVKLNGILANRKTLPSLIKAKEYAEEQYNKYKISGTSLKGIKDSDFHDIKIAIQKCKDANIRLLDAVDFAITNKIKN